MSNSRYLKLVDPKLAAEASTSSGLDDDDDKEKMEVEDDEEGEKVNAQELEQSDGEEVEVLETTPQALEKLDHGIVSCAHIAFNGDTNGHIPRKVQSDITGHRPQTANPSISKISPMA